MDAQTYPHGVLEMEASPHKVGISNADAGILFNSRKGYWRIAASPILITAFSNLRLEKAGFQFFYSYYRKSVAV